MAQDVPRSVTGFDRSVLRSMVYAADSLLRAREFGAAESAYAAVVAADSNSAAGHSGLASAILYNPKTKRNYREAITEFGKAAKLSPDNSGLLTRYGEALLPWRAAHGVGPTKSDSQQLSEAIHHLERAVELSPSRAEPHLGLYLAYLSQGRNDLADAQLRELARKDFFPKPVQDFAYDLLISVDSAGVLFTNGDMDLFPALTLQAADRLRPDVTVVNVALLNVPWYVKYLKHRRQLPISFSDRQIDNLKPKYDAKLQRTLFPGSWILRDVIDNRSKARGGCYFALTVNREVMAAFKRDLSLEGFVYRIAGRGHDAASCPPSHIPVNRERCTRNLTHDYRIPDFDRVGTWKGNLSPVTRDYSALAIDCAAAFLALADEYASHREIARASGLLRQACTMLNAARQWKAFERVLDYWLKVAPDDPEPLKLRKDRYGR